MKPKVLLLFPNTSNDGVMPLAIAILSTIAKQNLCEVYYFETTFYKKSNTAGQDRELTGEFKPCDRVAVIELLPHERLKADLFEKIESFKPEILGVHANSLEWEFFCELADGLKSLKHKPFVIIGGIHATAAPEEVIQHPYVDALCIGEGEGAWHEFLIKFGNGKDITDIRNLWVKKNSRIYKNPSRTLLSEDELWAIPLDFSYFDKRHFISPFDGKMYHRGQVELSRGCPYRCTYCANVALMDTTKGHGKFMRVRPFKNMQEAILKQIEMGADMIQLQDECFFAIPYKRLEQFCLWYGNEISLPVMVQTRPESVTDTKAKLMADMNVPVQISCGIESGCERILKLCNRKTTLEQIINCFKIIKNYNMRTTAYAMIGFPTETREEAFQTIHFIKSLDLDVSIMSIFYPFVGTPLRKLCIERGYITGKEKCRTFTEKSILKNQPMSVDEIYNIRRTFSLYVRLPQEYFPQIELCEKDFENHKDLFYELVTLSNSKHYKSWNLGK